MMNLKPGLINVAFTPYLWIEVKRGTVRIPIKLPVMYWFSYLDKKITIPRATRVNATLKFIYFSAANLSMSEI